jgi:TolA-binding protein
LIVDKSVNNKVTVWQKYVILFLAIKENNNMRQIRKKTTIFLILSLLSISLSAQKTEIYKSPEAEFRDGIELIQKEKFVAAQHCFEQVIDKTPDKGNEMRAISLYYRAYCAGNLMHRNTEQLYLDFFDQYPQHNSTGDARFYLARYYFQTKSFKKCSNQLALVDFTDLKEYQKVEFNYRKGYCFFVDSNYTEAKKSLIQVKDLDSKYKAPATYYYSHIAYLEKNYETARLGFESLRDDEYFNSIVPFYIIQIYYLQGKYDKILEIGPGLLEKSSEKRKPDITRMIGEAYYNTNLFKESIPYFEQYIEKSSIQPTRSDFYQLGYASYRCNQLDKAIKSFAEVTSEKDSLCQISYYFLGDCYLKKNNKNFSANSFLEAYKLDFLPKIKEDALYNYAKLQYELSSNPFQNAIVSFENFVNNYPNSAHIDEVNSYLVAIYESTKNYKSAIESLEKINKKGPKLLASYQRMTHFRALELFNDDKYTDAIAMFDKSLKNQFHKAYTAQSLYWLGESYYRLEKYDSSILVMNKFLTSPGAYEIPEYIMANYTIGYGWFKQQKYSDALTSFRKFNDAADKVSNKTIVNDALNRTADCFFIQKNFSEAITYYDKSIELNLLDVDYALYQKALSYEATNKPDNKITALNALIKSYPNSNYIDDSYYQLARTYNAKTNFTAAIETYNTLISKYPNSQFVKASMLELGLVYNNADRNNDALIILKKVVSDYPGMPESKDALMNIKNIYIENNDADGFFKYANNIPYANISNSEQDSLTFKVAYNLYLSEDCEKSRKGFADYLTKFPNGFFIGPANFCAAECDMRNGKPADALKGYEYIINNSQGSSFEEKSLLTAAGIEYANNHFDNALKYYERLKLIANEKNNITIASLGKMRILFNQKSWSSAINAALEFKKIDKITISQIEESSIIIIRSALAIDSLNIAQNECNTLLKSKAEAGAEAKYTNAYIEFRKGDFDIAEKKAFDLLSSNDRYEFWVAKTYILLGDIYVEKGDLFQAKYTYKNVIDNYKTDKGEDLKKIAEDKYNAILEIEKSQNKPKSEPIDDTNTND